MLQPNPGLPASRNWRKDAVEPEPQGLIAVLDYRRQPDTAALLASDGRVAGFSKPMPDR